MEKATQNDSQISILVVQCLSSLRNIVSALGARPKQGSATVDNATSYEARFKLWVGTFGAHRASGQRSLQYRLRDASSLRNHIIALLQDLCDALEEGKASDSHGTTFVGLKTVSLTV